MSRPRGSYGEVTLALLRAAEGGPCTVRELAARACVGFDAADRKASVLLQRGDLVALCDQRPRILGLPACVEASAPFDATLLLKAWRDPQHE